MNTGPQYTSTQAQAPRPGGGRGGALLIGGIAFAVVFLLIVAVTVGYLVVRSSGGSPESRTTPPISNSATPTDSENTEPTDEPTEELTDVTEERCWVPEYERVSSNPSSKLRGGGLEFIPPALFTGRQATSYSAFFNDTQVATAPVESTWYSTLQVGAVQWQPGVEYPGNEAASKRLVDCMFATTNWGDTSGRTLDDALTEPVTIAGMSGYRTTAIVNFGKDNLEKTDATKLVVVVLDTEEGPSAFISEFAVGVPEHEQAAAEAYESITGLSG